MEAGSISLERLLFCFRFKGDPFQIPYNSKGAPLDFKGIPLQHSSDFKGDPLKFQRNPLSNSLQLPFLSKRNPLHIPANSEGNPLWFQRETPSQFYRFPFSVKGDPLQMPPQFQRQTTSDSEGINISSNSVGFLRGVPHNCLFIPSTVRATSP